MRSRKGQSSNFMLTLGRLVDGFSEFKGTGKMGFYKGLKQYRRIANPLSYESRNREVITRISESGLFDLSYYLRRNPDVEASKINPILHYLEFGAAEGRDPAPLFKTKFYLEENPDIQGSGMNPLDHFVQYGAKEGRNPNPFFETRYYLERNLDVLASGMNPLVHFIRYGAKEGRDPGPLFQVSYYLQRNPDVAKSEMNPLEHYLEHGQFEGRGFRETKCFLGGEYIPPTGLLPGLSPLNFSRIPVLSRAPRLNILVPGLALKHMSGGPNTAVNIGYRLAELGIPIRFISTDSELDSDLSEFWNHLMNVSGVKKKLPNVEVVEGYNRNKPLYIGENDLFLATAWWTAQMVKYGLQLTRNKKFFYLIQDYEPLLHPSSTQYALAMETYELDYQPIVNSSLLFEFLVNNRVGRFADPSFADQAVVFEPAVDKTKFYFSESRKSKPLRLLFYTRPKNGLRNLFELGVAALQHAVHSGVFNAADWEFVGMGESFSPVSLGNGAILRPASWKDFDGYAEQMRESDLLLSLMLSPHPSYPPLEMAACGGVVVTTAFSCKTKDKMSAISENIFACKPTIEEISGALREAVRSVTDVDHRKRGSNISLPSTWDEALSNIVPALKKQIEKMLPQSRGGEASGIYSYLIPAQEEPKSYYEKYRQLRLQERQYMYCQKKEDGLLSFITSVWNTDPEYLEALASTVFGQDTDSDFEWVILDNGCSKPETVKCLQQLAQHSAVRLFRVERNLGIVGGMRFCLEQARNRYVLPLDSDDLLTLDCARIFAYFIQNSGYPAILYSDEDKVSGKIFEEPYFKPGWDPVLFLNSCYIAHLCAIDRELALAYGAYTDSKAECSHDWDTFTLFLGKGKTPVHVPEVVYSWRKHELSTASNMDSKPQVFESQQTVLEKQLDLLGQRDLFVIERSPLFGKTPDWWVRRVHHRARPMVTLLLRDTNGSDTFQLEVDSAIPHRIVPISKSFSAGELAEWVEREVPRGTLIHLLSDDVQIEGNEWPWEAMGHFEMFPDAVMIGGCILFQGRVVDSGRVFGFGMGGETPDRSRSHSDPGYSAQMWKQHSVSSVSSQHAVVDREFFVRTLRRIDVFGPSLSHLGNWLGAEAICEDRRVIYSPFFSASLRDGFVESGDHVKQELAKFWSAHSKSFPDTRYYSSHLGLSPATAYRPVPNLDRVSFLQQSAQRHLPSYSEWLRDRVASRKVRFPLRKGGPKIAILTAVYHGSAPEPLSELGRCILNQTYSNFEWVVLAQGPITSRLHSVLEEFAMDPRVKWLHSVENAGIISGLRKCLESAEGDYVLPVDGDDLLTEDALQVLASSIVQQVKMPEFIFSDEDIIENGCCRDPYLRPSWDPILALENSYVWHACAFRRETALTLGVFSDSQYEYCQDWDTILRFKLAGYEPVHVPEVLYHWRRHTGSSTNSDNLSQYSEESVKNLLCRTIQASDSPDLYEVTSYPLYRGVDEPYIRRRPSNRIPADIVMWRDANVSPVNEEVKVFGGQRIHEVFTANLPGRLHELRRIVARLEVPYVVCLAEGLLPQGDEWIWEAIKLFELEPKLAICSGRVTDEMGRVLMAGTAFGDGGNLLPLYLGQAARDAGPFAIALKNQKIFAPVVEFSVMRTRFLAEAMSQEISQSEFEDLSICLGTVSAKLGKYVAYVPLMEARVKNSAVFNRDWGLRISDRGRLNSELRKTKIELAGRMGEIGFRLSRYMYRG